MLANSSISKLRITLCFVLSAVIAAVFFARLFVWQIVQGDKYKQVSDIAAAYSVDTQAVRGEILDVDGTPLAINKPIYNLTINKMYVEKNRENEVIEKVLTILNELNIEYNDILPIVYYNDTYDFAADKEEEISILKSPEMLNINSNASADECMTLLTLRYSLDIGVMTEQMRRDVISVRYAMEKSGYSMTNPYTVAENISEHDLAVIAERTQGVHGIKISVSYERYNPNGTVAPHIVGKAGSISAEEYEQLKNKGYTYNDTIGKSGIESGMEEYLKGSPGQKLMTINADGSVVISDDSKTATPGNTVYLTIDSQIQQVLNRSLEENVTAARENGIAMDSDKSGEDCFSGAAVVLNVKDFSVIAAASYPTFDLQKYSEYDYYTKLVNDEHTPLFNRAFNGLYAPGSVFKCCVAAAALEENIIQPSTQIKCTHIYDYYKSDVVHCMGTHGLIDMFEAMAYSCNYYFADVGRMLGIETMYLYAQRFGLGEKTGVEMYESTGTLAGRDNDVWYDANTVKAAIGQSNNAFTPLQLATYAATIANNGTRLKTHLVSRVTSYDRKETVYENDTDNPTVAKETGISKNNINTVKKAMRKVVTDENGTANSVFGDYKIPIAAKTGTAENAGSDHATFICFAPYDEPEIAIAVVLEHGAKGKYSMSVAKDIMDSYFNINQTTDTDTQTE